jgi:hypothetical protein
LHKPSLDSLFNNIISEWISLHLKSIVQRIGLLTTDPSHLINRGNISIWFDPKTRNWAWAREASNDGAVIESARVGYVKHSYTVLKEFRTQEEIIAPAFGEPSGGI